MHHTQQQQQQHEGGPGVGPTKTDIDAGHQRLDVGVPLPLQSADDAFDRSMLMTSSHQDQLTTEVAAAAAAVATCITGKIWLIFTCSLMENFFATATGW